MKKILLLLVSVLFFASCGVGTYSYSSGVAEKASIVILTDTQKSAKVYVDGTKYKVQTVKESNFTSKRDMKKSSENTIAVEPGQHTVEVVIRGEKVYSKKVYVSNSETKVIKL